MTRYIDADALIDEINKNCEIFPSGIKYRIENAPTADVVEVVRCGECKWSEDAEWVCTYFEENGMLACKCPHIEEIRDPCEGSIKVYKPTDYCSYGERRE